MPKLWLIFCCHQQKIQKMSHFWHFHDHNSRNKYDNWTWWPHFFVYFSSSFVSFWYISFMHFKTFKIQFHGVCPLHYVLACKIHIYLPKMTLSSLLTWMSFFYTKFSSFWDITCSVPNLIPIYPRSQGL